MVEVKGTVLIKRGYRMMAISHIVRGALGVDWENENGERIVEFCAERK